jgi:hypothetical protein
MLGNFCYQDVILAVFEIDKLFSPIRWNAGSTSFTYLSRLKRKKNLIILRHKILYAELPSQRYFSCIVDSNEFLIYLIICIDSQVVRQIGGKSSNNALD